MKALTFNWLTSKDYSKFLTIISYLLVFDLVPFLLSRNNAEVGFHARQGFIQMLIWVLIPFILLIPLVGWVIGALLVLANLALMITGIYSASTSKRFYVPFVGKFFDKILS